MEVLIENFIAYLFIVGMIITVLYLYFHKRKNETKIVLSKIEKAKDLGFHEPVSLHPVVDLNTCIGSGACIAACPEKDILGLANGQAAIINASRCVGHGSCFRACPVRAITLVMGTEERGVELPHVTPEFETNVKRIYIAGELGGMGLIKNAIEQGKQAIENISKSLHKSNKAEYDVIIVGAGPAGISATLTAKQNKLRYLTLEQNTLGGTVYSFPRSKVVLTSPINLPLYGKVKFKETNKTELLELWNNVISKNDIKVNENEKVESVDKENDFFIVKTNKSIYTTSTILLSIGRRGSPRKIGVPGENLEKVMYRLLEPELIHDKDIIVVGGGDSAIEAALLLCDERNNVTLSYRRDAFARIKPKNFDKITEANKNDKIKVIFNSNIKEIKQESVILKINENGQEIESEIPNDLVYCFLGGELPNQFLQQIGISISKKFGEAVLKHAY